MLEAVIFDIGNVLLHFDFGRAWNRISPWCEMPPAVIPAKLESLKHLLEGGQISQDDFFEKAAKIIGYSGPQRELIAAWEEIFEPIAQTADLVAQLKGKVPLYLLSNTNVVHSRYFLSKYQIFNEFSDSVFSFRVQMMKPDLEIYEYAIVEFGINPRKTLFIDDLAPNVAAAKECGLMAWQYNVETHNDLVKYIRSLGLDLFEFEY